MLTGKNATITKAGLAKAKGRLISLCKDIIADDIVDQREAYQLENWLMEHEQLLSHFPANVISARLCNHLADGRLDKREAGNLLQLLRRVVEETGELAPNPGILPYNSPQPTLDFCTTAFCLTGSFALGDAAAIGADVVAMGGSLKALLSDEKPTAVVIGYFTGKKWLLGQSDAKDRAVIEDAILARAQGKAVVIVSEEHLMEQLINASGVCME